MADAELTTYWRHHQALREDAPRGERVWKEHTENPLQDRLDRALTDDPEDA
jgi:hypothetical protein